MRFLVLLLVIALLTTAYVVTFHYEKKREVIEQQVQWYESFYINRQGRTMPIYISYQVISGVTFEIIVDKNDNVISANRRSDRPTVFELRERAK